MKTDGAMGGTKVTALFPPRKLPDPPLHLSAKSRKWWLSVSAEFELTPTDYKMLTAAGEALDSAEEARKQLKKDGLTYVDHHGVIKGHPAAIIMRDSAGLFAKLVKMLRLDGPQQPAPGPIGRPPGISTPIGKGR
jgi:P27 family predicted phage terminase small subunit